MVLNNTDQSLEKSQEENVQNQEDTNENASL